MKEKQLKSLLDGYLKQRKDNADKFMSDVASQVDNFDIKKYKDSSGRKLDEVDTAILKRLAEQKKEHIKSVVTLTESFCKDLMDYYKSINKEK